MRLSRVERLLLANQFKILAKLCPDDVTEYEWNEAVVALGYQAHYEDVAEAVHHDDKVMTEAESDAVLHILEMFSQLKRAYDRLSSKSRIKKDSLQFRGFHANEEFKQLAYAEFFCNGRGPRDRHYSELKIAGSDFPVLEMYSRMSVEWEKSKDKYKLTRDDLIRIAAAATPPERPNDERRKRRNGRDGEP